MKKVKSNDSDVVTVLTLTELSRFCGAEPQWIVNLIAHGVIEPSERPKSQTAFEAPSVLRAKKARRLERDLGLNMAGIALVLDLLEERDQLRRRLARFGAS